MPNCPTTAASSGRCASGCSTASSACGAPSHTIKTQPEMASIRTINLTVQASEVRKLAIAIDAEAQSAKSQVLAEWAERLEATCEAHVQDAHSDDQSVTALRKSLVAIGERARRYAFEMDFSFLLSPERKLLSIGYRVEERQLDESCYDLLASEARLTSLFGIAKGDLPTEHWFRLGRPIVEIGFRGALMSWSGSMFEYLMPPLVMKEPHGGILNQTSQLVIKQQIQYGRSKNVPWGISEAAYNARDRELTYQYTNFGVPGLGLKRGLGRSTVIAPYATVLAAQFMPARGGREPGAPEARRRARPLRLSRRGRLHAAARARRQRPCSGLQLHGAPPGHVDRGGGQCRVRGPHARPLPQRPGDRIRGTAAAGEGAARHSGRDGAHRGRRARRDRHGRAEPGHAADPQPGAGAALDQPDVERPLFGDGDGDRLRLQPLERHGGDALAGRPDRGPAGQLHLPARHRDGRMVVGNGRAAPGAGRALPDAFFRRQGELHQDRRHAALRGRGDRGVGRQWRGTARHAVQRGPERPADRADLVCRTGAGARSRRQRAPGLLQDVRADRDRARPQRDLRQQAQALGERGRHRGGAFRDRRRPAWRARSRPRRTDAPSSGAAAASPMPPPSIPARGSAAITASRSTRSRRCAAASRCRPTTRWC